MVGLLLDSFTKKCNAKREEEEDEYWVARFAVKVLLLSLLLLSVHLVRLSTSSPYSCHNSDTLNASVRLTAGFPFAAMEANLSQQIENFRSPLNQMLAELKSYRKIHALFDKYILYCRDRMTHVNSSSKEKCV